MHKKCKQCSGGFEITDSDQDFYDQVSPTFNGKKYKIPSQTLCPDCRQQIRLCFRNEKTLYKRKCDLCSRSIVAIYDNAPFPVYCQDCFWGDKWNALDYGMEVDLSRSIFEQIGELMQVVPRLAVVNKQSENSEYCNYAFANKNCYLLFGSHYEEDCMYGRYSSRNKDCLDYLRLFDSELCYECMFSSKCYRSVYLDHCEDCSECYFGYDLKGCRNCLFSSGLRNKQYFIFNEEKSKEEYEDYFKKLKLSSYKQWQAVFSGWLKFRQEKVVFRSTYQMNCENCEGTDHANSKNLKYCFACDESEDCSYGFHLSKSFNCIDNSHMGYDRSELAYNTIGTSGVFNCFCCESSWHDNDLICCGLCFNSKDCFGSVAMRHNQYCILNKQYSKKEYDEMVPKIIERMILNGEWGQFFPRELALFGYNESVAQEYYPLEKKKALEAGWQWKDEDEKESGSGFEIPDDIGDVDDDVCEEVLICEKSGRPYKILERERSFYKKLQIPIPRLAPDQRVIERQRLRSPMKLWQRECMKCSKEHLSVFGPKCKEKIYCEKCYLEEVY